MPGAEVDLAAGWIDASVPVSSGMVHWPDDPEVEIGHALSIERGDPANVTKLSMSAHTGTHMDAPRHFIDAAEGIDQVPLDAVIGAARVVEIRNPELVTADEIGACDPREGERLLLRTRNSERRWWAEDFDPRFVSIEPEAAALIADSGVRTIGVDYLSVGGMSAGRETHLALLEAGVWIIEGLVLAGFEAGDYELLCLPLRLVGCDGSPARALLRPAS